MKKELLGKKFRYCIVFCLLFTVLFWTHGSKVKAEELKTETVDGKDYVLQAGGLLKKTEDSGIALFSVDSADVEGVKAAIKEGWDKHQETIDIEKYGISIDEISVIYFELLNKNPKYFYVENSVGKSWHEGESTVASITVTYLYDAAESAAMIKEYNKAVDDALSSVEQSWSDLEKVLYVNDYLAVNGEYDTTLQNHSAYNMLVDKTAVCQGYALAFQELMNELGISCELVTSKSINHAWNAVQIENEWYYVDVTWNDPLKDRLGRAAHAYLLKSDDSFQSEEHAATDYVFTGSIKNEDINNKQYDDFLWKNIDNSFGYYDGFWYTNDNGTIKKYSASETGFQEVESIIKLNDLWFAWGSSSSYWGNYGGCAFFMNRLYYATPQSIKAIDLKTGTIIEGTAYELSDREKEEGYIYGFRINKDGTLEYGIATSPNDPTTIKNTVLHTHSYGEWNVTQNATCTEEGIKVRTCECGKQETEKIPVTAHAYQWETTKEATCTQAGEKVYRCTECNEVNQIQEIAQLDHNYGQGEVEAPDCENAGKTTYTCSECGNVKVEEGAPALGHISEENVPCTVDQKCTRCQKIIRTAGNHDYNIEITKQATCSASGKREYKCKNCTYSYSEEIPATNHHTYEWNVTSAATCTSAGEKVQICTVCGKEGNVQTINPLGHLYTKTTKTAATFTKTGSETTVCTICGETIAVKKIAKIACKKNQTYKVGNYKYKIISPKTNGKGTVSFVGLNKNVAKVTIGNTVTIRGAKFKITQIGDKALKNKKTVTSVTLGTNIQSIGKESFYGTAKLKTITIKSQKLTKVGKNALKNIYKKARIKVPKSKLKKYQSLLKKKGQKSTVKVSK